MIIRLGSEPVYEAHQCLKCGVIKADPSESMCSLCTAMLRAVLRLEWFRNLHEAVETGVEEYMNPKPKENPVRAIKGIPRCLNCGALTTHLWIDCTLTGKAREQRFCPECCPEITRAGQRRYVADRLAEYPLADRLQDLAGMPKGCKRNNGTYRAAFHSREQAEAFAANPRNHPTYLGDLAHECQNCGYWHLSKASWLGISVN
jgi:hypothetical protein